MVEQKQRFHLLMSFLYSDVVETQMIIFLRQMRMGVSISADGMDLILEISSVGIYEVTATPISRITTLEPGQNWNKAMIEVTPAEIILEKGTVFARSFNGTTEIDHFDMPTLTGLAPGDEVIWQESSFQYTNSAAGTNTIEGANWTIDWGTVNLSNYEVTGLPTVEIMSIWSQISLMSKQSPKQPVHFEE